MRLLVYKWMAYAFEDVLYVFKKLNIEYDILQYDFYAEGHNKHYDEMFVDYFKKNVNAEKYDAIFSIAYWAPLSDAAMATGLKYISWSYDCPLDTENPMRTFANPCNYMFLFDKVQTNGYKSQGLDTVYHMPLGINVDRYSTINSQDARCEEYKTEVSFVGNMYRRNTDNLVSIMDDESAATIRNVVMMQKKLQGQYILDKVITDALIEEINKRIELKNPNMIGNLSTIGVRYTLAHDVTNYNRLMLLMLCAKRFKTDLYTGSDFSEEISGLNIKGQVNYYNEMPWIFAASKVNLNSTFLSIQSGLPLRVLDIMASGGFLLSNRQSEFEDEYTEDKDVVLFSDFEEAIDKITYYLSNEEQREEIAKNGRVKTFEKYNMEDRIKEIMNISL